MKVIQDVDIPTANAEELIEQYSPWIHKLAIKYSEYLRNHPSFDIEDLEQVGRIGILKAQKTYDPSTEHSFLSWSAFYIKTEIRNELRLYRNHNEIVFSLNKPLPGYKDITLQDAIPDPSPNAEEMIIESISQDETSRIVKDAVNRIKSDRQREVITRVYLNGQTNDEVASDLGLTTRQVITAGSVARQELKRDRLLRKLASDYYDIHVGMNKFNTTFTSATELSVLLREKEFDAIYGEGEYVKNKLWNCKNIEQIKEFDAIYGKGEYIKNKMWKYKSIDQIGMRLHYQLQEQRLRNELDSSYHQLEYRSPDPNSVDTYKANKNT